MFFSNGEEKIMNDTVLEVKDLTKKYGCNEVLHSVSFSVKKGEILSIIGPSGAGKSTLIRLLDGLEPATSGEIRVFGKSLHKRKQKALQRRMGVLFQKTVLFDRSVEENIALGLSYRHIPSLEKKARVADVLSRLNMSEYQKRNAKTLSGGEGQRVAFARVLVTRPDIIFLDEPTANLDPLATSVLEQMILEENRLNNTTIILNTHDQAQAQRLATRTLVLMDGSLVQNGTPDEVLYAPATASVARFVGMQNILLGVARDGRAFVGDVYFADVNGNVFVNASLNELADASQSTNADDFANANISVMLRAEDVFISRDNATANARGRVLSIERHGAFVDISVELCNGGGTSLLSRMAFREFDCGIVVGSVVSISWNRDQVAVCMRE